MKIVHFPFKTTNELLTAQVTDFVYWQTGFSIVDLYQIGSLIAILSVILLKANVYSLAPE